MSYYRFFASDKEMPEFDDEKAKPVVVNDEVVAINFANGADENTAMRIRAFYADWDEYLKSLDSYGLNDMLEIFQKYLDAYYEKE